MSTPMHAVFSSFLFLIYTTWWRKKEANLQSGNAWLTWRFLHWRLAITNLFAVLRASQIPLFDEGLEQAATFLLKCYQFWSAVLDHPLITIYACSCIFRTVVFLARCPTWHGIVSVPLKSFCYEGIEHASTFLFQWRSFYLLLHCCSSDFKL